MTQSTLLDAGAALSEVTFCVVDLETTGGATDSAITEVAAVRARAGEVIEEFQTLVNPGIRIPAPITALTGITDAMVTTAPPLAEVLPAFLRFAAGCVLVVHNADFDVGFLRRACASLGCLWPAPAVVDTVTLARSVLPRSEVPNCRLATLATYFHATVTPDHRALADARATVDVLHGLIERVTHLGVRTVADLLEYTTRVGPARRACRGRARRLPSTS